MTSFRLDRAVAADAAAVSELVAALEASLYGRSTFSQADLEGEWSELDLERDVRVVRDGHRVVGYGAARHGARRVQNGVLEADDAARRLLESLGYGAVRVFRELRIELAAPPPPPEWPDGLRVV